MASRASGDWPRWYDSSGVNSFTGSWSATVSRSPSDNYATVTIVVDVYAMTGDPDEYYLYVNGAYTGIYNAANDDTPHVQGNVYTLTYSYNVEVGGSDGTISGNTYIYCYHSASGAGGSSSIGYYNLYYGGRDAFTISYNANGGEGAPEAQTKYAGIDLVLNNLHPYKDSGAFLYWNTSSDGSGTMYIPGGIYSADANATLYAIWSDNPPTPPTPSSYTVKFDANGGYGAPEDQSKTPGTDLTLSSVIPKKPGYTFYGWNTMPSTLGGTAYSAGGTYSVDASVVLYGIYSLNRINEEELDMNAIQYITLDVNRISMFSYINAKQMDSGRYLNVRFTVDGDPYNVPLHSTVLFRAIKPDGNSIYNMGYVKEDGTVMVNLTSQTLAAPGKVLADISIIQGGVTVSSVSFAIIVKEQPADAITITSTNEFLALSTLVAALSEVDGRITELLLNKANGLGITVVLNKDVLIVREDY